MSASLTANQAAAEIVALINSRPTSPTKEEIAAIIAAKVQGGIWSEWAPLVAEWKAACVKITAAKKKASAWQSAVEMAIAEARAANRRLEENAERILAEGPMRGPLFAAAFCLLHHCFVVNAD